MTNFLMFLGASVVVGFFGWLVSLLTRDDDDMAEAVRRSDGYLVQDEEQERELLRRYNECRERMGKDCCVHPEYQFNEKHRLVTGDKK
jgi:hypothetical protein